MYWWWDLPWRLMMMVMMMDAGWLSHFLAFLHSHHPEIGIEEQVVCYPNVLLNWDLQQISPRWENESEWHFRDKSTFWCFRDVKHVTAGLFHCGCLPGVQILFRVPWNEESVGPDPFGCANRCGWWASRLLEKRWRSARVMVPNPACTDQEHHMEQKWNNLKR